MIFNNADAVFRVLDAVYLSDFEKRSHVSARAFCALSYRINSDTVLVCDNKKTEVKTGDITFFPINKAYSRISRRDELIAVHFELFGDYTDEITVYTPKNRQSFDRLFHDILNVCGEKKYGWRYEVNALLNTVFADICKENPPMHAHSEMFLKAVGFINNNYSNSQLTVSDIADYCGISEGYLRRIFRDEAGISPKRFLNKIRIQHAIPLVNSGFYSISRISETVGFYDPKYFSVVYRKYAASSPHRYPENPMKF